MNEKTYKQIETYMLECVKDTAHDPEHVYRVLYSSLEIASELNVNMDALIAAALLHDVGRSREGLEKGNHAELGARMAYDFLLSIDFGKENSERVRDCVLSHSYRVDNEPNSLEARILFDADKLDAAGAVGIARTLIYCGIINDPLYTTDEQGRIRLDADSPHSFCTEYTYKLKNVYDKLYTAAARRIAGERRRIAADFFRHLQDEVDEPRIGGKNMLMKALTKDES